MTDQTRPVPGYPAQPPSYYPPGPPPQPNYYNNNQYYAPSQQPPRATFYRRIISLLLAAVIAFAVILFVIYLILRPRVPILTLSSLSLSSLNLSTSQISATWTSSFHVTNPNSKLHVYYDQIEARLFYSSSLLAVNQLPPFDQSTKSQTNITAILVATSAYISPELSRRLNVDRSKNAVNFDVQVLALVRFKARGWRARRRGLLAYCDDLSVAVNGNNGSFTGDEKRCAVEM